MKTDHLWVTKISTTFKNHNYHYHSALQPWVSLGLLYNHNKRVKINHS
jgi:hypothetical protein